MKGEGLMQEASSCCQETGYWGYHLILDCKGCERVKVKSRENIISFVGSLVTQIDMVAYGDPVLAHFGTNEPSISGYSLIQLIETSSITGHFVDSSGDAYLDIFSCKIFDIETVKKVVIEYFNPEKIKVFYLTRQA